MNISLYTFASENLVSRDGFGISIPTPNLVSACGIPPEFRGGVHPFIYLNRLTPSGQSRPSLSGHSSAYRWRSLPRVRRHRASKPQGSSKRVLPWQVTMGQIIYASPSHTHYWYEVGILKVPVIYIISDDIQ